MIDNQKKVLLAGRGAATYWYIVIIKEGRRKQESINQSCNTFSNLDTTSTDIETNDKDHDTIIVIPFVVHHHRKKRSVTLTSVLQVRKETEEKMKHK